MIRAFLNSEHFQPPDGVLVTQILHERPSVGLRRRPVQNALAECGLTTADAEHLIFEFSSLNFAYEENQPPKRHKQRRTEHVIARNGEVDGKSVTIFDINYHPAAAKFDETVRRVFTDTWELIYGLKDFGVLQVVPVRKSGEKFIPNHNDTRDILVKKDTLIMLPPKYSSKSMDISRTTAREQTVTF